jgi:putative spermidine/putrescine transport system ATP-binding protein
MAMADRLVVMRDGRVQQVGRQEDLYERPATPFVARFIGNSNLVTGMFTTGQLHAEGGGMITPAGAYEADGPATLAVRPERITLAPPAGPAQAQGTVLLSSYMGAMVEHVVALNPATQIVARAPSSGPAATQRFSEGERVSLLWPASSETLFDGGGHPAPSRTDAPHPSERITSHA